MAANPTVIQTVVRDIGNAALDPAEALAFVSDDAFGGIDMFIGRVRRQSHGRAVTGIHYDMFDPLALTVFARAAQAAVASFGPALKVYVGHAKGRLAIGDLAVVIAVGSPHRDEAFRACREVIETVKHQAPIWKQEHFVDGATIGDVKAALGAYAASHWDGWHERILRSTVLASKEAVLRNDDPVPPDGHLAILPPVSGG